MRHNYVGDEGDYYKYALLRALCGADLQLGVVWYLYTGVCNPEDGKKRKFLEPHNKAKYRPLDSNLYDKICDFHKSGVEPHIKEVREREWITPRTIFFEDELLYQNVDDKLDYRNTWLAKAKTKVENCDVVFLDPDNGLEIKSKKKHHIKAEKFAFYDEIAAFWQSKKTNILVIYQHQPRKGREIHIQECFERLCKELAFLPPSVMRAVVFGSRFFLVLAKDKHVDNQLQEFANHAKNYCHLIPDPATSAGI